MKAKPSGSFKPVGLPEPQTTVARCYSLIDIGTVPNIYKGKLQGNVHRIFLTWELPKLKAVFNDDKGEEPFVVSEEFTLSTKDNSNLAKLIASWRNNPLSPKEQESFDPSIMVGKTALIQFHHKRKMKYKDVDITEVTSENTNMKIMGISKRPADMAMPAAINPVLIWDWEVIESGEEPFDKEKWEKIPKFLKSKIEDSEEYKKFAPKDSDEKAETLNGATEAGDDETVSKDEW